jgi:Ca2+-binding EF-hand superfamily protein
MKVFHEFDTDQSGFIDWAEFKAMLPKLGVRHVLILIAVLIST